MREIAVITGTRAEYGILKPVLNSIKIRSNLNLFLIVTGMHLSKEFGDTVNEIKREGFEIKAKLDVLHKRDSGKAMADSIGKCVREMAEVLDRREPDILLLLGDRGEMLAGAIAASYMNIPIAHIHGGEISGNVDEPVRHAITKLAHIHFAATQKNAERIIKMGENKWRVFVVGAPGLDTILNKKFSSPFEIASKYTLNLKEPLLLVVQHPVTTEVDDASYQIRETLEAVMELGIQMVLVYPNADAGGRRMIKIIKKYEKYPFIKTFKSLPHDDYLDIMKHATVMVGNSSSGIIEAPSFHLPVVNIGTRQEGRQRAENVLDVGYNKDEIIKDIKKALYDRDFRRKVNRCANPYGDGKAGQRIADILSKIKIDKKLIQKRMAC